LALNVNASSSVAAVKSMIQEREGKKEWKSFEK
jgi:hypothetical protein